MIAGTPGDGIRRSERHVAIYPAAYRQVLWVDPPVSIKALLRERTLVPQHQERMREVGPNGMPLTTMTVPGVTQPVLRDGARRAVKRLGAPVHTQRTNALLASPLRPEDVEEGRANDMHHSWAARSEDIELMLGVAPLPSVIATAPAA